MLDFDGPNDWELEGLQTHRKDRKDLTSEERRDLWFAAALLLAVMCSDWL